LRLLRVKQWAKNAVVLVALLFSGKFTESTAVSNALLTAFAFCALSSATYIFNDIADSAADRLHPKKKNRPIASGEISTSTGIIIALACLLFSLVSAATVSWNVLLVFVIYAAVNVFYSKIGKHKALIDIFCIAAGFVLRVIAGAVAVSVVPSSWLLVCTTLGALFLAVEKRRQELLLPNAEDQRTVLRIYKQESLSRMESLIAPSLLTSYAIYTSQSPHGQWMMLTVPLAVFGIMRYQILSEMGGQTEAPEEVLWSDRTIQVIALLWAVISALVIFCSKSHG